MLVVRVYPSDEMLNNYPRTDLNRNVYAYSLSGDLLWQIQEAPHGGIEDDKAYMDLRFEEGQIIVGNWIGVDYVVDHECGEVSQSKKNIRPW